MRFKWQERERSSGSVNYISSRGGGTAVAGAEAIRSGIAVDGGLFVPLTLPVLPVPTGVGGGYIIELVATILAAVLPDYSSEELRKCSAVAYAADKFDDPDTVPLTQVGTRHVLGALARADQCFQKRHGAANHAAFDEPGFEKNGRELGYADFSRDVRRYRQSGSGRIS